MNELGYCEIYKPNAHGILDNFPDSYKKNIYTSILFQYPLDVIHFFDESSNSPKKEWEENGPWIGNVSEYLRNVLNENYFVRNTCAIKLDELHIIKKVFIDDYTLCIIKTCWIKIFQRKWKKYYKTLLNNRKQIKTLFNRSITGKWN